MLSGSGGDLCQARLNQAGTAFPAVMNIGSHSLRRSINRSIREAALSAIPAPFASGNIVEATAGYRTTLNEKGLLSLRFEDYIYPVLAAHGLTVVKAITLDLNDGYVYHFGDLFLPGSGYKALLDQIIARQIEEQQIPMLTPFRGVGEDEEYYLTPDSLVIFYQLYEYTPNVYGILEFVIPYTGIAGVIDPRGPIARLL